MKTLSIIAISFYVLIAVSLVDSKIRLGSFMKYMKFMKANIWNKNKMVDNHSDLVTTIDNSKVQMRDMRDTGGMEVFTWQDFSEGTLVSPINNPVRLFFLRIFSLL